MPRQQDFRCRRDIFTALPGTATRCFGQGPPAGLMLEMVQMYIVLVTENMVLVCVVALVLEKKKMVMV